MRLSSRKQRKALPILCPSQLCRNLCVCPRELEAEKGFTHSPSPCASVPVDSAVSRTAASSFHRTSVTPSHLRSLSTPQGNTMIVGSLQHSQDSKSPPAPQPYRLTRAAPGVSRARSDPGPAPGPAALPTHARALRAAPQQTGFAGGAAAEAAPLRRFCTALTPARRRCARIYYQPAWWWWWWWWRRPCPLSPSRAYAERGGGRGAGWPPYSSAAAAATADAAAAAAAAFLHRLRTLGAGDAAPVLRRRGCVRPAHKLSNFGGAFVAGG